MQNSIVKKSMIFGIIFLFIGIGIQPVFASEITNDTISDNIEDCNCQVDDNNLVRVERLFNRIESLLDRVEIFTNLIPLAYKDNPEVIKDFEELSEKINTFKEMKEEFNSDSAFLDDELICDILWGIFYGAFNFTDFLASLMRNSVILTILLYPIGFTIALFGGSMVILMIIKFPQCL